MIMSPQCILKHPPDVSKYSVTEPSKHYLDKTALWLIFQIVVVNIPGPFKYLFYGSLCTHGLKAHAIHWNTNPN